MRDNRLRCLDWREMGDLQLPDEIHNCLLHPTMTPSCREEHLVVSYPMSKDKGLVSGLHRNSAYRLRRAALASSLDTSGVTDKHPVPIQSCRIRSVRMVMFLAP